MTTALAFAPCCGDGVNDEYGALGRRRVSCLAGILSFSGQVIEEGDKLRLAVFYFAETADGERKPVIFSADYIHQRFESEEETDKDSCARGMSRLETLSEFEPARIVFSKQLGVTTLVSRIIDGRVKVVGVTEVMPRGDDGFVDAGAPTNNAAHAPARRDGRVILILLVAFVAAVVFQTIRFLDVF